MADAIEEHLRQLLVNSKIDPEEVLKKIKRAKVPGTGFNTETRKVQDLHTAGVLVPSVLAESQAAVSTKTEGSNELVSGDPLTLFNTFT